MGPMYSSQTKLFPLEIVHPVAARNRTPTEHRALLLANPDIGRWYKDHRRTGTARVQLEQLELFCRRVDRDPHEIVKLAQARPTELKDTVLSWIEEQRKNGRPDSYLASNWEAVRSWLKSMGVVPSWSPRSGPSLRASSLPEGHKPRPGRFWISWQAQHSRTEPTNKSGPSSAG